ncbi:WD40-repeat-containing domain protein [Kalaharituber pfeilii]|nr:WD40-repeat-containing domain protein [Kalaharituber pfeilii]
MAKRKRSEHSSAATPAPDPAVPAATATISSASGRPLLPPVARGHFGNTNSISLQIIAGSYEKVLHGFIASIPVPSLFTSAALTESTTSTTEPALQQDLTLTTSFSDSFLFTAHTAPLRCIALSPPSASKSNPNSFKRILATGAPDERINLYTLSSSISYQPPPSALSKSKTKSTSSNKHLGTLHEHTNTPTVILFTPTRNKLIAAGEDSQILIFRTRDWSLLSTLKVPRAKPTGSTVGIGLLGNGERPGGVNDIALHPSQKILLSVSKGERALRMWNLMTGRKAGVLGFTKDVMGQLLGNRIGGVTGEGQRVRWSPSGDEFAVAFERGVVIFGMDSQPRLRILTSPISKVHQMHYVEVPEQEHVLAISTEDGRVIFYSTTPPIRPKPADPPATRDDKAKKESKEKGGVKGNGHKYDIDNPVVLGQLGGREMGMVGRVKDFVIVDVNVSYTSESDSTEKEGDERNEKNNRKKTFFTITAGSDGTIRIWSLHVEQLAPTAPTPQERASKMVKISTSENVGVKAKAAQTEPALKVKQVGNLLGIYETGRRITCLTGMVMEEGWQMEEEEEADGDEEDSESSSDG